MKENRAPTKHSPVGDEERKNEFFVVAAAAAAAAAAADLNQFVATVMRRPTGRQRTVQRPQITNEKRVRNSICPRAALYARTTETKRQHSLPAMMHDRRSDFTNPLIENKVT